MSPPPKMTQSWWIIQTLQHNRRKDILKLLGRASWITPCSQFKAWQGAGGHHVDEHKSIFKILKSYIYHSVLNIITKLFKEPSIEKPPEIKPSGFYIQ